MTLGEFTSTQIRLAIAMVPLLPVSDSIHTAIMIWTKLHSIERAQVGDDGSPD